MNKRWIAFFLLVSGCVSVPSQHNATRDTCKLIECPESSTCRDIFDRHQNGNALDVDKVDGNTVCSFGTYFDYDKNTVIGDENNLIGSLHTNLIETSKVEGACVFSPLGAFYFTENKWNLLPELFTRAIYQNGAGNQNCLIHYSIPEANKPPDIFLKFGGIWLGDRKSIVFQKYGEVAETKKFSDGFVAYIFVLDKANQSYLAVETFPGLDNFIWSIQISGEDDIPSTGLLGVNIGSSESELTSVFGAPTKRKSLTDIRGELLLYQGKNYSFELNDKKKVRSIKIIVPDSFTRYLKK